MNLELLLKFGINVKTSRIIDAQMLTVGEISDSDDLIVRANNSSLKHIIGSMRNSDKMSEAAIRAIESNEKRFPFDANNFLCMYENIPIISNVSKDFLRYSANDIFLTACAAVEILFMDKLDKVKVLSQKKLDDFYKYWNKYKRVRDFRDAEYTRREFTVITQGSVSESHHITQLLMRWKELSEAIELINLDIKEINDILRIDSEQKEIITRKFEAVVNILF